MKTCAFVFCCGELVFVYGPLATELVSVLALGSSSLLSCSLASWTDKQQPSEISPQWFNLSDWTMVRAASEMITESSGMLGAFVFSKITASKTLNFMKFSFFTIDSFK